MCVYIVLYSINTSHIYAPAHVENLLCKYLFTVSHLKTKDAPGCLTVVGKEPCSHGEEGQAGRSRPNIQTWGIRRGRE